MIRLVRFAAAAWMALVPAMAVPVTPRAAEGQGALALAETPLQEAAAQAFIPALPVRDTEANRSIAADRYLEAILGSPFRNSIIQGVLNECGLAGLIRDTDPDQLIDSINLPVLGAAMKTAMMRHFTASELNRIADYFSSPAYPAEVKRDREYHSELMLLLAQDDRHPAVQAFVRKFQAEFGGPGPDALAVLAYDSANLMLDAVRRAARDDGPAIRDALQATDTATVCGQVRFDGDRNPVKSGVILRIVNGRRVFFSRVDP